MPGVTNVRADGRPTRVPGGAEASIAERRPSGRTRKALSGHIAITNGTQDLEQASRRSCRSTRSSQAETQGERGFSAATVRSQVQIHLSARPAELSKKSRTKGMLNRRLDEHGCKSQKRNITEQLPHSECGVSSPSRRSKRSRCFDVVEDEQPSKRLRNHTRYSVLSSHDASDIADTSKEPNDSKTSVIKAPIRSCDKKGASTKRGTGGEVVRAVSNLPRRSKRIAERKRKQTADVAAQLQGGRSRSAQRRLQREAAQDQAIKMAH